MIGFSGTSSAQPSQNVIGPTGEAPTTGISKPDEQILMLLQAEKYLTNFIVALDWAALYYLIESTTGFHKNKYLEYSESSLEAAKNALKYANNYNDRISGDEKRLNVDRILAKFVLSAADYNFITGNLQDQALYDGITKFNDPVIDQNFLLEKIALAMPIYFQSGISLSVFYSNAQTDGFYLNKFQAGELIYGSVPGEASTAALTPIPVSTNPPPSAYTIPTYSPLTVAQINSLVTPVDPEPPSPSPSPSHGAITIPAAQVMVFDDSYPVVNDLTSHTTTADGVLLNFAGNYYSDPTDLTLGTQSFTGSQTGGGSVCSLSDCADSGVVRWGKWATANSTISQLPRIGSRANDMHYIIGNATSPSAFAALTGTASFAPVGGTTATDMAGNSYTTSFGNIAVNFSSSSATLTSYSATGHSFPTGTTFTNVPLTIVPLTTSVFLGTPFLSPGISSVGGNRLAVTGFFAGPNASHIGAAFQLTNSGQTISVNQVQAFKR